MKVFIPGEGNFYNCDVDERKIRGPRHCAGTYPEFRDFEVELMGLARRIQPVLVAETIEDARLLPGFQEA